MLLPTTYLAALLLLLLSMFCWGSWANTQKLAGAWRFELFYYDYAFGVLVAAALAAYMFGESNTQDLTFTDNLLLAGYRKMAYAVGGGAVFNLANMLLVAAIAVTGMAVAFPVSIGLALVIGVVWNYILNPQGNPLLLFGGATLVAAAIVVDAFAYNSHLDAQIAVDRPVPVDPRYRGKSTKPRTATKGIVLSVVSGILMGTFYPLVEMSKSGDNGVGPYGVALLFAAGVFATTFLYNPFFMNFPAQGEPVGIRDYFRGSKRQHMLGVLGGMVWCAGGTANFVAASAPASVSVGPAVSYAMGQGATLISALWGLLVWREFKGASERVKLLLVFMIVLFTAGLGMVAIAPLFVVK